uniref:Uncharacterized protein n=1 Tax=Anguilla anguilla TaxID=7936 RepID=A0A0E9QH83_ANGAN
MSRGLHLSLSRKHQHLRESTHKALRSANRLHHARVGCCRGNVRMFSYQM